MADKPGVKRFQYSLKTLIVIVVLAAMFTGPLVYWNVVYPQQQRERSARAASANYLHTMGSALSMYEGDSKRFPDFPTALLNPNYFSDAQVFVNPRFRKQDVGYIYISGSTSAMPLNVVMYENVPEELATEGRNVLLASGSVEWVAGGEFENCIKKTENAIRAAGGNPTHIPISRADLKKRQKN